MRLGLVWSDGLRVGFLGGWSPVSLLFPHECLYTQPMLILISCSDSYHHSTPGYTVHQATVLMHGLGDLISASNF